SILLRSLPVQHPESLVVLRWHSKDRPPIVHGNSWNSYRDPRFGFSTGSFPFAALSLFQASNPALERAFGFAYGGRLNALVGGQAEVVSGLQVTGGYFSDLGVRPAAGRLIGPEDDRPGAPLTAVISFGLWQTRLAANSKAIGQTILVNNKPFT